MYLRMYCYPWLDKTIQRNSEMNNNERAKRSIEEGCLMDDLLFELFFRKESTYIEFVIHEIFKQLNRPLLKVVSVYTQHNLKTLGGYDP